MTKSFRTNFANAWRKFIDRRIAAGATIEQRRPLVPLHDNRDRQVAMADAYSRHEVFAHPRSGLVYSVRNGSIHNVGR